MSFQTCLPVGRLFGIYKNFVSINEFIFKQRILFYKILPRPFFLACKESN